ncbi:unnamed protein product [Closterium sp. Naga37s-1]|nr:unnamed protein product [Closterium sp. Naga37s-1]
MAAAASFAFSPALRFAFVLLLVSGALRPAESEWIEESGGSRKGVSLTRSAHAQLLLRRQRQRQQRPATAVVRGGPGGDAIVSAVGFPLVRSAASDGFSASDGSPVASDGAFHGATTTATSDGNVTIKYHGGPVVVGNPTVNIYHIYYGSWGAGSGKEILEAFVQALSSDSGSQGGAGDASVKGWWAITAAYYQSGADGKKNVSSKVRLAGTVIDNYSRGKNPSDSDVHAIALSCLIPLLSLHLPERSSTCTLAVSPYSPPSPPRASTCLSPARAVVKSQVGPGKPFPLDPHGIYVLLTSADVIFGDFCKKYCGFHTQDSLNSTPLRFAFVGHHGQCPNSCGVRGTSPNGNPAIDATITTLAHEITEAATNPDVRTGWFVDEGGENADKCSWDFGSTKTVSLQNGQKYEYNLVGLNGMKFLVQQNWDCVLNKHVRYTVTAA